MMGTQLVAILNLTPDSFSDGGSYPSAQAAADAIARFIEQGAEVIDIGAESTRPGATPLTQEEEWERLVPVLELLPQFTHAATFSIDTRHAATAKKALEHGVDWINDVSGFADPAMVEAVRDAQCKLVVMHSLSVPADKTIVLPESADAVQEVLAFGQARLQSLMQSGIARERLIFDPGVGFGKTAAQSWALIEQAAAFKQLGVPLLIGHSRKSFLAESGMDRDSATLNVSGGLIRQEVDYLRIHDVAPHKKLRDSLTIKLRLEKIRKEMDARKHD